MIEIFRHMDEFDIAREIQMEGMVHKGSFLVLEGSQDAKRFFPFVNQSECSIVCTHSVRKAELALRLLNRKKVSGVLAVLDADFTRITGARRIDSNVVCSSGHDLDLDWATAVNLARYLNEVSDESKVRAAGGVIGIYWNILKLLEPISCARFLNCTGEFKFKVSNIEVGRFFCKSGKMIDLYIDELISCGNIDESDRPWISQRINQELAAKHDLVQLTNGHDFFSALGSCLMSSLGRRKVPQAWGSEVGMHIRLSMDQEEFGKLNLAGSIRNWEAANRPYRILS